MGGSDRLQARAPLVAILAVFAMLWPTSLVAGCAYPDIAYLEDDGAVDASSDASDSTVVIDGDAPDGSGGDGKPTDTMLPPVDTGPLPVDAPACPSGATRCGPDCVDTKIDRNHCGSCSGVCETSLPKSFCAAGSCKCRNDTCGFGCTRLGDDPLHCGGCVDGPCNADEVCSGGSCNCRPGLTACLEGGITKCVDLKGNARHCNACTIQCIADNRCVSGTCYLAFPCPPGRTECPSPATPAYAAAFHCADTKNDATNCGACGKKCLVGSVCVAGFCKEYVPAQGCLACPCSDCATLLGLGTTDVTCCPTGSGFGPPICVNGSLCPSAIK